MTGELVLSLFPGIGILDRGFEEHGFCVVRGPDLLWGGDIKLFHPPAGVFDGVIGGPPCQAFSPMLRLVRLRPHKEPENLIPEFERVVAEAQPRWFVMENTPTAPYPSVGGYLVRPTLLDNRWLGYVQRRRHRFSFGTRDGLGLSYRLSALEASEKQPRVLAAEMERGSPPMMWRGKDGKKRPRVYVHPKRTMAEAIELQGLPADFFDGSPFTKAAQGRMIGNAVALPMARELARAVREAIEKEGA